MTRKDTNLELAGSDGKVNGTWRDLAHRIEQETDPAKVMELARQLLIKLDEEGFVQSRRRGTSAVSLDRTDLSNSA